MSVSSVMSVIELYKSLKMYNSLKKTDDEILVSELVRRGYEIASSPRENSDKPAAEARHHDDCDRVTSANVFKIG